ncbi:hypothetical protein EYF80_048221 [Liparis tanakae]|uniref:Uncharacterized protein n=1 Tax=Liparis tanakae TaxID=230148 RepID=A0A4Z2FK50_9TELE|nr:hypothetical protein EYF80_048221 [Liparis tanakae]
MTSSLSSRESGEELESVSMPSESLLLSSLMLITPPLSTVCFGTLCWRPRGFPDRTPRHGVRLGGAAAPLDDARTQIARKTTRYTQREMLRYERLEYPPEGKRKRGGSC